MPTSSPESRWRRTFFLQPSATPRSRICRRKPASTRASSRDWCSGYSAVHATQPLRLPPPSRCWLARPWASWPEAIHRASALLAACTALLVAALAFIAWLIRAGAVLNFVSETVLVGFKCGIALVLTSTQLPKLFGFKGSHGNFWERMGYFFSHVNETHPLSLMLGAGALVLLLLGKRFLKNKPVALVVMIAGIALASFQNLGERGVKLLGAVPNGLPTLGLPAVHASDVNDLLPLAMACFLLGAVETAAIGRMFALKHGTRFVANREFLALAASNLLAGLGRGFPVSGGNVPIPGQRKRGRTHAAIGLCGGIDHPVSGVVFFRPVA